MTRTLLPGARVMLRLGKVTQEGHTRGGICAGGEPFGDPGLREVALGACDGREGAVLHRHSGWSR